ncbi:DUF547 domain-containing protein [Hymenobacter elongatus]|uniref:DUF547 domain-containing protein n=1 Tax=Hymenobacter elongatus TaxID=877208 RepID=A0A4Z0PP29_9BACT|nr:DUF547 domain-containing protein [Hymenobacter elongatus]TGE18076.1 DUF547 domain-containing protein [Hymenobacter elongatus]
MRFLPRLLLFALLAFTSACQSACSYVRYFIPLNPTSKNGQPVDHTAWNGLLKKYVDSRGMVNYAGFKADSAALNGYLTVLRDNLPTDKWNDQQRLAYWINAYNAFTIQRVIRAYPIKSIKDLGGDKTLVNTVWDQRFIQLGDEKFTLNDLEQRIMRKQFEEPRIHFALVCAAMSCPKLRNEAYTAERLTAQLDEQGRDFMNDPTKNQLTPPASPKVSAIFSFYPKDFEKNKGSIQQTINRYATQKVNPDAALSYMEYDWALNVQK